MATSKHSDLILDQFTRQAVPFATAPSIKDEAALRLVVEFSGAGPDDTVLDVACGPGLIVVDSAPAPDKADAFNRMEVVRDPSHVRALPEAEHLALFRKAGLPAPRVTHYRLEGELEALVARSFPKPGDDATLRRIFADSLAGDTLGIQARRDPDGAIRYGYPVAVLAVQRP